MTKVISLFCLAIILFITNGCSKITIGEDDMKHEMVKYVVDNAIIESNDDYGVIEPVWFSVSIYDGEEQYNKDLSQFSTPQRYVFAIEWYMAEVNNGGHDQFYFNSTGIVWEDAMKGFKAIGAQDNYDIIKESAEALGGNPNKNRKSRQEQLDKYAPDFNDLDVRYYESEVAMLDKLHQYIKDNAKDFYYDGEVKVPK